MMIAGWLFGALLVWPLILRWSFRDWVKAFGEETALKDIGFHAWWSLGVALLWFVFLPFVLPMWATNKAMKGIARKVVRL